MEKYLVVIQKSSKNYGAYSPDVLGCVATGKTIEETLQNMHSALQFHLEAMAEDGEDLPIAKGLSYYLSQKEPFAESNDFITNITVRLPQLV